MLSKLPFNSWPLLWENSHLWKQTIDTTWHEDWNIWVEQHTQNALCFRQYLLYTTRILKGGSVSRRKLCLLTNQITCKATIQSYNCNLFSCCKELLLCTPFCGFLSLVFKGSDERRTLNHRKKGWECEWEMLDSNSSCPDEYHVPWANHLLQHL